MATKQQGQATSRAAPKPGPQTAPRRTPIPEPRRYRQRATVRRVDPWTVLKLSLVFYFCVLLVVMLGLTVFWAIINQLGVIESLQELLLNVGLDLVTINGGNIARVVFLLGLLNVMLFSGINVFMAFLYNLLADVLGGLRVTFAIDEQP